MEIQANTELGNTQDQALPAIDDVEEQAASANDQETQDGSNDSQTEANSQSGNEDDSLSPKELRALHKMRQKDREELNGLKQMLKSKEERDQALAAQIVGDVIKNPSKLGDYLSEYGLSNGNGTKEEVEEKLPDFENMSVEDVYKTLTKRAEEIAAKKATAVARSETTYANTQREVHQDVSSSWKELMDSDKELRENPAFQRTVSAMANDLLREAQDKKTYKVGSEASILKSAYGEVMKLRGKSAPTKITPEAPTETPTSGTTKTVPKRRGNTDADILTRVQRRLAELDAKHKD